MSSVSAPGKALRMRSEIPKTVARPQASPLQSPSSSTSSYARLRIAAITCLLVVSKSRIRAPQQQRKATNDSSKEHVKLPSLTPTASTSKPESPTKTPPVRVTAALQSKRAAPPAAAVSSTKVGAKSHASKANAAKLLSRNVPPLSSELDTSKLLSLSDINATLGPSTIAEDPATQTTSESSDALNAPGNAETALTPPIIATEESNAVEEADAAALETAEAERVRKARGTGTVNLLYEQYNEEFAIVDGSTTQAAIDDVYCLSFVMPACLVHLSRYPNAERFERESAGVFDSLVHEDPRGVYHNLERDATYYVVVEQEADQLRRDQDATRAKWQPELERHKQQHQSESSDGRGFETCSCVYGNPCVDEYGCKDWHARFAIATANGWKGF